MARPLVHGVLTVALLAIAFSGCLQPAAPLADPGLGDASLLPRISLGAENATGSQAIRWTGRELIGPPPAATFLEPSPQVPTCKASPKGCEVIFFNVSYPDGGGCRCSSLEVTLSARPGDNSPGSPTARVFHQDRGVGRVRWSLYSSIVTIEMPEAGAYRVEVRAREGRLNYTGSVQFEFPGSVLERALARTSTEPARDLLPDLVMMRPLDLKVDLPVWGNTFVWGVPPEARAALAMAGVRGCAPDEVSDYLARRCLRVSTAVGDIGEGPLIVELKADELPGLAIGSGQFRQQILRSDGSLRSVPASNKGSFHLSHAHLHYPELVRLQVFAYDVEKGVRGAEVGRGSKTGFCLEDEGIFEVGVPNTSMPRTVSPGNCFLPADGTDPSSWQWSMGIWPQWFDMYETYRTGQYAEISGVPDGAYEFVVTVDPMNTLTESDEKNNENSVRFRLKGDRIEFV